MSRITASTDLDRVKPEELPRYVAIYLGAVSDLLNGKLDFETNVNCKIITVAFASASTDTTVAHGLGRAPLGYIVYGATAAMAVYDGSVAWTAANITLKSSAIGSARLILI